MKSGWITHKGRTLMYCDYTHLTPDELEQEALAADTLGLNSDMADIYTLANVEGMLASPRVVSILRQSAARVSSRVRKTAVIGLGRSDARLWLFNTVVQTLGIKARAFDDAESAKDWLIGE